MVEVHFQLADPEQLKDHFLSVRVGDFQRVARVNGKRAFRFPASAVGARKYGKVEVFRKVGGSAISIDPVVASGTHDVECWLDGGVLLSMKADVVATDAKGLQREQQPETATSPKGLADSPSRRAAAEYLSKHHLEVRLSDAMQRVIRERPDDPARALAEMLLSNADTVAKLPRAILSLPEVAAAELPAHPEAAEARIPPAEEPMRRRLCFGPAPKARRPLTEGFEGAARPATAEPQAGTASPAAKGEVVLHRANLKRFGENHEGNFQRRHDPTHSGGQRFAEGISFGAADPDSLGRPALAADGRAPETVWRLRWGGLAQHRDAQAPERRACAEAALQRHLAGVSTVSGGQHGR